MDFNTQHKASIIHCYQTRVLATGNRKAIQTKKMRKEEWLMVHAGEKAKAELHLGTH